MFQNEDLELLLKINMAGFSFLNNIPKEDRLDYFISYDFHLIQRNKHLILTHNEKLYARSLTADFTTDTATLHQLIDFTKDKISNTYSLENHLHHYGEQSK